MPCYQVNYRSVEFKITNVAFLKQVLNEFYGGFVERNGILQVGSMKIDVLKQTVTAKSQDSINLLKRNFSEAAVKYISKKRRWALRKKASFEYQARRY